MKKVATLDFLHDENGSISFRKADDFCIDIKDIIKKEFAITDNESTAIFRILLMIINHLRLECNKEDQTIEGIIKLLNCEFDAEYEDEHGTLLDCVISKGIDKYDILYNTYQYHCSSKKYLPKSTVKMFSTAWEIYKKEKLFHDDNSFEIKYIKELFENNLCVNCNEKTFAFSNLLMPGFIYGYYCKNCDCFYLREDISNVKEIKEAFHVEELIQQRKFLR